ncbi:MAG: hypothetical protein LBB79_09250, partial [Prevotellaceae bacterium]|nr:hypothetical protein [Prevotellaceae bacterium]
MKKNYFSKTLWRTVRATCLAMLLLYGATNNVASAATKIAGDLITLSEANDTTWYYIEVPYNSQFSPIGSVINDNAGRGFTVLTSKGASTNAQFNPLRPNNLRSVQQWAVVANGDKYSLVNRNGKYFGNLKDVDDLSNATAFTITIANSYFVKMLNGSNLALGADSDNSNARFNGTPSGTDLDIHSNTGLPSAGGGGLRTLRFVPIAQIDDYYPFIFEQNQSVTKWFFIKSLHTANSAAPYLTLKADGTTFELAAKNGSLGQLFGFVSSDNGERTNIVSAADPAKYLYSGTATKGSPVDVALSSTAKGWILRHVVAPKISPTIQGIIRDARGSGSKDDGNHNGGSIIAFDNGALKGDFWTRDYTTYNNKYAWAFHEKAAPVKLTGANVTVTAPYSGQNSFAATPGDNVELKFAANTDYGVTEIKLNSEIILYIDKGSEVIVPNKGLAKDGSGNYTLTFSNIQDAQEVNVSVAKIADTEVAVTTYGNDITVTSPTTPSPHTVTVGSDFTLEFTSPAKPFIEVTPATLVYTLAHTEKGKYTLT